MNEQEKRRYEVRYIKAGADKSWHVHGWHDTKRGAERMRRAWEKHPDVVLVRIWDRGAQEKAA